MVLVADSKSPDQQIEDQVNAKYPWPEKVKDGAHGEQVYKQRFNYREQLRAQAQYVQTVHGNAAVTEFLGAN